MKRNKPVSDCLFISNQNQKKISHEKGTACFHDHLLSNIGIFSTG
jgi:hypothetical protein